MITETQLLTLCPKANPTIVKAIVDHGDVEFRTYGLVTPLRIQHFFAHVVVESGHLTRVEENLNYSAKRLTQVWPRFFPTLAVASKYANNPEALANKVYAGRLGNKAPNDGWLNRGRGLLQTTGAYNMQHLAVRLKVRVDELRHMLTSPEHMLKCAVATFVYEGAMPFADADDIGGSTKAINGGSNGLVERKAALAKCKTIFL